MSFRPGVARIARTDALFAIQGGRGAGLGFEYPAEMLPVGKPDPRGDLLDRFVRIAQQAASLADSYLLNVTNGRGVHPLAKAAREAVDTHVSFPSQNGVAPLPGRIVVDHRHDLGNVLRQRVLPANCPQVFYQRREGDRI